MSNATGYVQEIFGSFQGEGPYVGERHAFVRLCCCNLKCLYCDTPASRVKQPAAYIEQAPCGNIITVSNPLSALDVADAIKTQELRPNFISAVSITGGEPLEQVEFVEGILLELKGAYKILLETNGTLAGPFGRVRDLVDVVSMDIKLPSVSGMGGLWDAHAGFLDLCKDKELIVKVVVAPDTPLEEVSLAAGMVAEKTPDAVFVIQPVTSGNLPEAGGDWLLGFYSEANRFLNKVRVIPQVHKLLRVR